MRTGSTSAGAARATESESIGIGRGVRECKCGARSPGGGDDVCATAWSARSSFFRSPRRSRALRESPARGPGQGHARGRRSRWRRSTSPRAGSSPRSTPRRSSAPACAVRRAFGLGPRELVAPALREGLVDVVPEYAGTAVQFLSLGRARSRGRRRGDPRRAGATRCEGTVAQALAPAPAQDANAFVVRREVADRLGLDTHERPPRGCAAADLRRAARVRDPAAVPRGPAQGLRHRVRGGRAARRRRSADPPGARHRHRRRRAAVQHRPGHRRRRPRRAGRRPRAAAGRERHADRPPRRGRAVRDAPGRRRSTRCRRGWTPTRLREPQRPGAARPARSASTATRWLDGEQLP